MDVYELWKEFKERVYEELGENEVEVTPFPYVHTTPQQLQADLLDLKTPYQALTNEHIEKFRRDRYVKLNAVFPPSLLSKIRSELVNIVAKSFNGMNPSEPSNGEEPKSWHLQMTWVINAFVRELVLSARMGIILQQLLGVEAVRLYHDNVLSRVPLAGCVRSQWHCDDGPLKLMAMDSPHVVTVWIPLQQTSPDMGALAFAPGLTAHDIASMPHCPQDEKSPEYDRFVTSVLEEHCLASGTPPDTFSYNLGDVSIHATDVFHTTRPNHSDTVRMILGVTYFDDGAVLRSDVSPEDMRPTQIREWAKFCPGIKPGEPINSKFNPIVPTA